MKEQITNRSPYKILQEKIYPHYAKAVSDVLVKEYPLPYFFRVGNTYKMETSTGEEVTVKSIFRYPHDGKRKLEFDQVYLIAFNSQGELVGHRHSWDLYEGKDYVVLNGEIALKERGKGYAMPIELVHQHILQEQATQTNTRIIYEVINDNKKKLDKMKPDLAPADVIFDLEKEQTRWQTLYSPSGKLGVNEHGVVIFKPELVSQHPYTTENLEVRLKRRDRKENGKVRAVAQITDFRILDIRERDSTQKIIDQLQQADLWCETGSRLV